MTALPRKYLTADPNLILAAAMGATGANVHRINGASAVYQSEIGLANQALADGNLVEYDRWRRSARERGRALRVTLGELALARARVHKER